MHRRARPCAEIVAPRGGAAAGDSAAAEPAARGPDDARSRQRTRDALDAPRLASPHHAARRARCAWYARARFARARVCCVASRRCGRMPAPRTGKGWRDGVSGGWERVGEVAIAGRGGLRRRCAPDLPLILRNSARRTSATLSPQVRWQRDHPHARFLQQVCCEFIVRGSTRFLALCPRGLRTKTQVAVDNAGSRARARSAPGTQRKQATCMGCA